jgi:hypothetical protein
MNKRHNYRWKSTEIDSLYREYELLEMTPEEIAEKHQRTVKAILYRLQSEGIIDAEARNGWHFNTDYGGWNNNLQSDLNEDVDDDSSDYDDGSVDSDCSQDSEDYDLEEVDDENKQFRVEINGRVLKLEESLFDMKTMVASILKKLSQTKSRPNLRNYES